LKKGIRKIASVFASAVMLGSTVGFAAAANYPQPFIKSGVADVAVVYGSGAAITDVSAAINVQSDLTPRVSSTSGTTASAVGGDSVNIATTSQSLYVNSALSAARQILTKDHLPTLLADGSAYDTSGTEYKYTQTITLNGGNRKVTFGKSGESIDPILIVDLGYQGDTAPIYNYTLTFNKILNVSASSVIGEAEISILGNKFVVGANSDYNTLYLYGSGTTVAVDEGVIKTITLDGEDHTIELKGTSGTTTATLLVDGQSRSMTKGSSYRFSGGFEIYLRDVFHTTKTGSLSSVDLLVGSKTLHMENGQAIRTGSDDTTILGTSAILTGTAGQGISSIIVSQGAERSIGDYLEAGTSFTDRVFGNLQVENVGPVPPLDSDTRDTIVIDTDNNVAAKVKFTPAAASEEYTLAYARDPDNIADSSLTAVNLAYDSNLNMSSQEGANAKVSEYVILNSNDEGRILRVDFIPAGTGANDAARLTDVITGEAYDFTTGYNNATTAAKTIGGGEYHLKVANSDSDSSKWTINVTWGAGSAPGSPGTQTTLFPRIKLANGEWLAFLTTTTVSNGTTYQLPGNYLLSTYTTGSTLSITANSSATTTFGNVVYNVTGGASNGLSGTLADVYFGASRCNFNVTLGPAILVVEEKTLSDSNGHAICVPLTTKGTDTRMPAISTPVFSDGVGSFNTLQSDSQRSQALTLYGTLVERDTSTSTNNAVTISYPDEQMYVDVFFKAAEASIIPGSEGSSGGGTVMIVEDTQVSSVQGKNLVVVGGSCINTVARKIVSPGATAPICGADWTALTNVGAGQYLIKAVESPYNSAKTAVLVAGYEGPNTVSAVNKFLEGHATDIDTMNVYPVTTA
jgi:hypothetical protein